MQLSCRLTPKNEKEREQLVSRLLALGFDPFLNGDAVGLEYEGDCDGKALAGITVFESFGCDRVIICKDWSDYCGEGQNKTLAG